MAITKSLNYCSNLLHFSLKKNNKRVLVLIFCLNRTFQSFREMAPAPSFSHVFAQISVAAKALPQIHLKYLTNIILPHVYHRQNLSIIFSNFRISFGRTSHIEKPEKSIQLDGNCSQRHGRTRQAHLRRPHQSNGVLILDTLARF